jgi:GNAT superfamily N-acetyltransferase
LAVIVRAARPSDKAPLMEFITRLWEGHDYIPRVWEDWISDKSAKMFVVEVDGAPVGMNRVRFQEDGTAWLEGARIHPDYRGRGLASMLGRNAVEVAAARGIRTCRLTCNSRNRSAQRQVAKMGFKEMARMSLYVARRKSRFRPQMGVRRARNDDVPRLTRVIRASREFRAGAGVYWDGFRTISLTPKIIRKRTIEGSVFLSGEAIAIAKVSAAEGTIWRQVCFACGRSGDVKRLIRHAFGSSERRRTSHRFVHAPQGSPLVPNAREAGLVRDASFILYEHRPPNG